MLSTVLLFIPESCAATLQQGRSSTSGGFAVGGFGLDGGFPVRSGDS
jgi:hypothetical protein